MRLLTQYRPVPKSCLAFVVSKFVSKCCKGSYGNECNESRGNCNNVNPMSMTRAQPFVMLVIEVVYVTGKYIYIKNNKSTAWFLNMVKNFKNIFQKH